MKALKSTQVPVPEVLNLCLDSGVVGTPFYVMRYVRGRMFPNPRLPGMSFLERESIYNEMCRVLASIHRVDLQSCGLASFGPTSGYIKRQVTRWHTQYQKSKTYEIPAMEQVAKWLEENCPREEELSLIHGDFRLDNMIWHPTEPKVLAVLDWELSTIGNPYSDVAYNCMPYLLPDIGRDGSAYSGFGTDFNWKDSGIPDMPTYLANYYQYKGCKPIANFKFYQVFSVFRAASILQGVFKRSQLGNASSSDASRVGAYAEHLAKLALDVALSPSPSSSSPTLGNSTSSSLNSSPKISTAGDSIGSTSSATSLASSSPSSVDLESMFPLSRKYYEIKDALLKFMDEEIYPREAELEHFEKSFGSDHTQWRTIPFLSELREKAKARGLWNLWIPAPSPLGAGLTNLEYAPLCAILGRSVALAPVATNCAAPDTGNMEVLMKYGSEAQKKAWLEPLLRGEIRSAFAMTEPGVASSDATNIATSIVRDGEEYVINGRKWWTSGAGGPDCKILIVMGKTPNPSAPAHRQQSMILVPVDAPGVNIVRALPIFGYYDVPEGGHMEVRLENVRVPAGNLLLGEGRGFEIAQGRLGPGRIHHCMRLVGMTERCLEMGTKRALTRTAFKRPIAFHGTSMNNIALSRIEIEQCRLLTYKAAYAMDTVGNKDAKDLIAMIKIVAPRMACNVIDRVIQLYGAAGLSDDFFIARAYAGARTLRLADGPDEVHIEQLAKLEYLKHRRAKL